MDDVRVAAFVTFHYRPHTVQYLDRVLRNLHDFNVSRMHVTIVSNVGTDVIAPLCRNYFAAQDFSVATFPDCQPGHMLTWMHKPLLREAAYGDFTHFLYQEDDIGLTDANFRYWLTYARPLRKAGLLPAFLCTEFGDGIIRACSAAEPTVAPKTVEALGQLFAAPGFPYCPCFIMDHPMLAEYFASPACDHDASVALCEWGPSERSAAGLCWYRPPSGFAHRLVLPVDADLRPLAVCQVPHMPNRYVALPGEPWGKLAVTRTFCPGHH